MGASDILATIPNVSKPNGQLVYENIASEFLIKTLNFGQIVITITDDNNREIDFLGISSYFLLKFNIFRRSLKKPMKFQSLAEYINKIPIPADETIDDKECYLKSVSPKNFRTLSIIRSPLPSIRTP
jgi:hypothetical protein